jgi:carbamoyl-phosphate synthase large subunit
MKIKNPNILIIGTGSSIGYTAVKQAIAYKGIGKLYVGNVNDVFPARTLSDNIVITPDFYGKKNASKQDYLDYLFQFVKDNNIHFLMSCSIFEIELLSENRQVFENLGCRILIETTTNIQVFYDKLRTIEFFKENNIPAIPTEEILEQDGKSMLPSINFPIFIKPKFGYGSNGIAIIKSMEEFVSWDKLKKSKYKPYIGQAYLDESNTEYSCTCTYKSNGEIKDVMVVARKKIEMVTTKAEYSEEIAQIEPILKEIARKIDGLYVLNFQFKLIENIPYIFEINPRFGAAEAIRIKFGVDMFFSVLSEYCVITKIDSPKKFGTVFRVYDEVLIQNF